MTMNKADYDELIKLRITLKDVETPPYLEIERKTVMECDADLDETIKPPNDSLYYNLDYKHRIVCIKYAIKSLSDYLKRTRKDR